MMFGWDLGGAHVKLAVLDKRGGSVRIEQVPCELWLGLDRLESALEHLLRGAPPDAAHALTMSGELADIFPDRAQGVSAIVQTFVRAARAPEALLFAGTAFVGISDALSRWAEIASANWRATAQLVAKSLPQALVLDVGSTTTDIVVVSGGQVMARSPDDHGRLACEELLYTGVVRTPVMALATQVPFGGEWVGLMAEHFATAADIYRITGELEPAFDQARTADGGGRSRQESMRRLARMIGSDLEHAPGDAWERLARWLAHAQLQRVRHGCDRQLSRGLIGPDAPIVGLGVGRFVAAKLAAALERPFVDFAELTGVAREHAVAADVCGPALAVARLALAAAAR